MQIALILVQARADIDAEAGRLHAWIIAEINLLTDAAYAELEIARVDIANELTITIERLWREMHYEIAIITQQIADEADATIWGLREAVRIEIHDITLELQLHLTAVIGDLNRGFELDVQYHVDMLHTELLIEIARITDWRDFEIGVYQAEANEWLHAHMIAIDLEIELTIAGYNDQARLIIAEAHIRIQQETHAAIGRLELEHSL